VIDKDTFARYVAQALNRFQDRAYLRTHPLSRALVSPAERANPDALQDVLADAIQGLRPAPPIPTASPAWRRYRHLVLRYGEGLSLEETARELMVSLRQAHRDHAEALALLTSGLWGRYVQLASPGSPDQLPPSPEAEPSATGAPQPPEAPLSTGALDAELIRVVSASAEALTPVAEVISGVVATLSSLGGDTATRFTVRASGVPALVTAAPLVLRQILLNVLGYIAAVCRGSIIDVEAAEQTGGLELRVYAEPTDESPTSAASGSSLGEAEALLDVAHRLVSLQGGELRVGPLSEGGPRVVVALPRQATATVLVVDDNPDMVCLFRRYLRARGYRLLQAATAEQAIRLADEANPDAIILDVLLPTRDGWEILQELRSRERTRKTPVVLCSILPEQSLARSLGVVDFLPKPVTAKALIEVLERLCKRAS